MGLVQLGLTEYDSLTRSGLISEINRLKAHNAMLVDGIRSIQPWVVTQVVACNGLKCREPLCESCSYDAERSVQTACNAYHFAQSTIAATAPEVEEWMQDKRDEVLEEVALIFCTEWNGDSDTYVESELCSEYAETIRSMKERK